MSALTKCLLLFLLNWLDAQLTIIWVRNGLATEGNGLMAYLLDAGNAPFLGAKLIVGAFVAYVLYRFSHLALARRGLTFVLGLYLALMFVHAATGISALGWPRTDAAIAYLVSLPDALLTALF
ncbi:MAG TPA: DUF5658 family protein [Pyrinomonadaceae bacterium]|nr:DUF5658 family protein [Pyrinomonadaceae bacterium]